jgi:hypothetical protein
VAVTTAAVSAALAIGLLAGCGTNTGAAGVGVAGQAGGTASDGTATDGTATDLDVVLAAGESQDAAPSAAPSTDPQAGGRGHRRVRRPFRLQSGQKVVLGTVVSASGGTLVLTKDGGGQVSVPTNDKTLVRGDGVKALADLKAGRRVVVKAGADGVALGVLIAQAHAAGTVTAVDGDHATLTRLGGLTVTLDLSGVTDKPAVGNVVIAVGTATDNGGTLKVTDLRVVPSLG